MEVCFSSGKSCCSAATSAMSCQAEAVTAFRLCLISAEAMLFLGGARRPGDLPNAGPQQAVCSSAPCWVGSDLELPCGLAEAFLPGHLPRSGYFPVIFCTTNFVSLRTPLMQLPISLFCCLEPCPPLCLQLPFTLSVTDPMSLPKAESSESAYS